MIAALLVLLTQDVLSVPASGWKVIEFNSPREGAILHGQFQVQKGSRVQVLIMDREQADRFRRGRSIRPLHSTGFELSGGFRHRIGEAGDYTVIVDNRIEGRGPTLVNFSLELTWPQAVIARELTPNRKALVVAVSLFLFGAVVVFSAHQFVKRHRNY